MREFVRRCERLDAELRSKGFELTVGEVEALVLAGLAVECELAGLDADSEWCVRLGREAAARGEAQRRAA